jgi:hypothetical protein
MKNIWDSLKKILSEMCILLGSGRSMKVYKGQILYPVDGDYLVVMDRDMNLHEESNFIVCGYMYRVVAFQGNNVFIKSI